MSRILLLAAIVLFAYGETVDARPWDFGKLLGIYAVFFFIVAQLTSSPDIAHKRRMRHFL